MLAPILESERLLLRPHRLEDFASVVATWSDPTVVRYIGGKPHTKNESWGRLLRYVGHWQLFDYGFWAVAEKATGAYLGELGFGEFQRDLMPPLIDVPEAGWVLAPHGHGKGYALEAMRTALTWMDAKHPRTQCIISPDNVASQKLAAKLGYVASHEAHAADELVTVWYRYT